MDESTNTRRRFRFQTRLATLFWITFSIACFFAGRNWEAISNSVLTSVSKNGTQIRVPTGKSTIIKSNTPVPRALVTDPSVCRIVPISPTQIQVAALAKGATSLSVWDVNGTVTTYEINVPK